MGKPYDGVELFSFHSTSKGLIGECGLRGGYLHHSELNSEVHGLMNKLHSINICPNTMGQVLIGLMCQSLEDCSAATRLLFNKEKKGIMNSLTRKAKLAEAILNSVEGVSCQPIQGSMFAFPSIELPPRFSSDQEYCMEVLENVGLVIVPGSGFGQRQGTNHFRMSILPPEQDLKDVLQRFKVWHQAVAAKKVINMSVTQLL